MVQEQASQDRQGLGSSGTTRSSKIGRTQAVLETLSDAWLLDSSRSSTVNQLERTESDTTSIAGFPIIEEHRSSHPHQQHHQLVIHQQARRHPLSTSDRIGNGNMELVSTTQHLYTGSTYSRDPQQDCRYGISTHVHQGLMANQAASIPMDRQDLGASLCGPIRRPHYTSPTKICLVASGSWHYPHGCVYDELDQMEESVHQLPLPLELNRQSIQQTMARTGTSSGSGFSLVAQCDLVFPVEIFGNLSSTRTISG
ncbi:unnamed protein product [Rhizopus microsporus]